MDGRTDGFSALYSRYTLYQGIYHSYIIDVIGDKMEGDTSVVSKLFYIVSLVHIALLLHVKPLLCRSLF